jgi:hypothetical protein
VTLELTVLRQHRLPDRVLEAWLGGNGRSDLPGMVRRFFRVKAQRSGANGGDAYRYRNPLGGIVVGTFSMSGLWVKTLGLLGLDGGGVLCRNSLGSVVVELRYISVSFRCHWWQVRFSCTFLAIFDLLCKRFSSLLCIGSAVWLYL